MDNVLILKPVYKNNLCELVENARLIDREIKKLTTQLESMKKEIKEAMGDEQSIVNEFGHVLCTYKTKNMTGWDRTAFKLSFPGVYEKFEYPNPVREFRFVA